MRSTTYKTQSSKPLVLMEDYMNRKRYSESTVRTYIKSVYSVLEISTCDVHHLSQDNFNKYISLNENKSSSFINQVIGAGKIFLKHGLNKKSDGLCKLSRPRKEKRLPKVIDREFLLDKLSNIDNLKHKTILKTTYALGLRRSEIINLKVEDIDSERMVVNIRQSKGNKDRQLPLSKPLLTYLENTS